MTLWKAFLGLLLCSSSVCYAATELNPRTLTWSDKSFGPDGPWQAITLKIGTPPQNVALYPGGAWGSAILLKSGEFGKLEDFGKSAAVPKWGFEKMAFDYVNINGFSVPNVSIKAISNIYQTYPGGQNYPVEVGILSLGAESLNQTFGYGTNTPAVNVTFVNSYLYTSAGTSGIPSYSYGMHIGSAALGIPGSLLLGGYDRARVIGDVSAQPYATTDLPIQLLDISIGVASGGSPWSYLNKSGLLAHANSTLSYGTTTFASPPDPYIYLPKSSCDAIAAELPVTYQPEYGLYFWDTSSPRYTQIVTSPSYLGFTFSKNALNNANITIKVPFALLNLTLEAPLTDKPTSYFPCMGTDGPYALGRAFLQAAFMGINWGYGTGNWFLAQAPGPQIPSTASPTVIHAEDLTIQGTSNSWENTWTRFWTEIPASSSSSTAIATPITNSSNSSSSGGLSTGAKVGIGVGCGVAGIVLIALALFIVLRRRKRYNTVSHQAGGGDTKSSDSGYQSPGQPYTRTIVSDQSGTNTLSRQTYELGEERREGPWELS
ncbi:hypothetical protein IFM46972_10043 [Aspergillus udagawae]|uniref:Peptidase A1 domain-containing protein n=1 Tax=Aspergillus udagawae TaxID=91492 RepID=A0A8H3XMZ0_9EURO|nr:hypothetical protein IFM46972_10043 [Aspergillus udagawae]